MTRRRATASVVGSPVLVGSVTVLIVIVSVFLSYNANTGLPFVPTYNLRAEVASGQNLVVGNEVRLGGFRVGIVDEMGTGTKTVGGTTQSIAVLRMKLDKSVEPLPTDTTLVVRPRSALGLKYVELTNGRARSTFENGDTIPLANSRVAVEFDDLLNTFDPDTRQSAQDALTGFGDALAGRGQDLNAAIRGLAPFFRHLAPVMATLSDPGTELAELFRQAGRTAAQLAPVAATQGRLFAEMADTFGAIGRDPEALRATIDRTPPTLDVATASLALERPFVADLADLSRRLRPAARVLPRALPRLNAALRTGEPVVRRSPALNRATGGVLRALDDLAKDPNTILGLRELTTLVRTAGPLFPYVNPFQSVCNYATYYMNSLGSHVSEGLPNGTAERVLVKQDTSGADNNMNDFGDRPQDLPENLDPTGARNGAGANLYTTHNQAYTPAIDAQGNANCVVGNFGYLDNEPPGSEPGRYPPSNGSPDPSGNFDTWSAEHAGGSHVVSTNDVPFLYGPTFTGVKNLRDVP